MTPRVATVLSAREWESDFVASAQAGAAIRLVLRAYRHEDIEQRLDELDVIVVGAETSWVSPALLARWRRAGALVVGIYPAGDAPAKSMLKAANVDACFADDEPTAELVQAIRYLPVGATRASATNPDGRLISVVGARGGPGRTEIAIALAWNWASRKRPVLLLDLDLRAPALAIRLNLPPRPDITDAIDSAKQRGSLPRDAIRQVNDLRLVVGSHRPGEPPLRPTLLDDLIDAALASFPVVVADLGPADSGDLDILKRSHEAVLVSDTSAVGLVRTARLVSEWAGPPPALVLNRASSRRPVGAIAAARQWTGLDPAAVVPDKAAIREAGLRGGRPDRTMLRALSSLVVPN